MTGPVLSLLLAVWVQGALAMALLYVLGRRRLPLVARGEVKIGAIALDKSGWPEHSQKAANAFENQFQLPLLFYVACAMAIYLGPGLLEVILAWLFVATRIVHAAIHITTNHVVQRFAAFATGFGLLLALWLVLGVRLVAGLF